MTKPHLLHHFIWNSLMLAPLLAVIGSLLGYFYTSRILLRQLELSLLMGLGCLLVYYLAHRWMLIQRRRLAFERAKSKRAEILAQRGREEGMTSSAPRSRTWWKTPSWIWIPSAPSRSGWCAPC